MVRILADSSSSVMTAAVESKFVRPGAKRNHVTNILALGREARNNNKYVAAAPAKAWLSGTRPVMTNKLRFFQALNWREASMPAKSCEARGVATGRARAWWAARRGM